MQQLKVFEEERQVLFEELVIRNQPELLQHNSVIRGCAVSALQCLPDEYVQTIVTSPPYYGQRDYGVEGQIGAEKTVDEYIKKLVAVFAEARRVLAKNGTLWLNLGDKYLPSGNMAGAPWRVALALQDEGWILRSDIIWYKPNAMPSSVKNRPTTDHEYIFMFAKSADYYYDADAIREPHVTFGEKSKMKGGRNHFGKRGGTPEAGKNAGNANLHTARWDQAFHPQGRNKRTVWEMPLSKFPDAHFAVFPDKLIEPCILAGSAEGAVVLDPFLGSGTTALVSMRNKRDFIGIEISEKYAAMAAERIRLFTPYNV